MVFSPGLPQPPTLCTLLIFPDDQFVEDDQDVTVFIETANQAVTLDPEFAIITIIDDDGTYMPLWLPCNVASFSLMQYLHALLLFLSNTEHFLLTVVNVTFSEQSYTIGEGDGQVEICLVVMGITLRNVTIAVTTATATASGTNYVYWSICVQACLYDV